MTPIEYQRAAVRTAPSLATARLTGLDATLLRGAMGLAGEAGELADQIKKVVFHGHDLDCVELESELGDVLWYVAVLANDLGLSLDTIMAANLAKLRRRYPEGFSTADSVARVDVGGQS